MGQPAVPPPSPAVLQAAEAQRLGEFVRGYTATFRTSDKPPAGKGREALMALLMLAAAALPLVLGLLVVWWLGVILLAGYGVALTVVLRKPVKHVYEFRAGVVAPAKQGLDTVRWDEATCVYQAVTQNYVNGVYGSTGHTYRLVTGQNRHVSFHGSVDERNPAKSLTQIDELGETLLREIPPRHLQTALDTLNQGGEVHFDTITISPTAITTPAGPTPWRDVRDLAAGGGHVALHTGARKPWQIQIAEIPNFPVFWTLAKELQTRASA